MTPPDAPSWGPDWVKRGERDAPKRGKQKPGLFARTFGRENDDEDESTEALSPETPAR